MIILAPVLWRDRDEVSAMTGVFNFVWHDGEIKGNTPVSAEIMPAALRIFA